MPLIPAVRQKRQKNCRKFKPSLSYRTQPCLRKKKKNQPSKQTNRKITREMLRNSTVWKFKPLIDSIYWIKWIPDWEKIYKNNFYKYERKRLEITETCLGTRKCRIIALFFVFSMNQERPFHPSGLLSFFEPTAIVCCGGNETLTAAGQSSSWHHLSEATWWLLANLEMAQPTVMQVFP